MEGREGRRGCRGAGGEHRKTGRILRATRERQVNGPERKTQAWSAIMASVSLFGEASPRDANLLIFCHSMAAYNLTLVSHSIELQTNEQTQTEKKIIARTNRIRLEVSLRSWL